MSIDNLVHCSNSPLQLAILLLVLANILFSFLITHAMLTHTVNVNLKAFFAPDDDEEEEEEEENATPAVSPSPSPSPLMVDQSE